MFISVYLDGFNCFIASFRHAALYLNVLAVLHVGLMSE